MKPRVLSAAIAALLCDQSAFAASQIWDGDGTNANWSTSANWVSSVGGVPGATSGTTNTDVATFNAAIANTWGLTGSPILINTYRNIGGISFTLAAGNYHIGTTTGNALDLTSGGTIQILSALAATNAVQTVRAPLIIQGANGTYAFANNSANGTGAGAGTLNFEGGITGGATGNTVLTLSGSNTNANTISGIIGNGSATTLGITKSGTGTWVLSGENTYTGTTTAGGGVLKFNNATALPVNSGLTITGGGVVGLTADFSRVLGIGTTQVQWTGSAAASSGGFAAYGGNRTVNLGASAINWNSTSFVKTGGTLILSAADADGTLVWATSISFAGQQRTIQVNNGSAPIDAQITGKLTGGTSSGLNKTGAGTLELTNTTNDYTGITTITEGTLEVSALANGGSNSSIGKSSNAAASLVFGAPTATLRYKGSANVGIDRGFTMSSGAGGGATIESSGEGTLSFDNTVAINYGTASETRLLTLGGTNTGNNTFGKVIADNTSATSLTKSGVGTWVLSVGNTHTGTTWVEGGLLKLDHATALPGGTAAAGTSNLRISGGGVVGLTDASGNFTRALGTSGTQVRWTGSGGFAAYGGDRTVNLGGNVTPTTVGWSTSSFLSGTQALVLSAEDADGTLIWQNGLSSAGDVRTIQVNNGSAAVDARITGKLTAGGGFNKAGAGTLELTNSNNDYTGATTINAGTLLIGTSGSLANTTSVTAGGATATGTPTLGGGGTIAGATTIAAAGGGVVGTHAPGVAGVSGGVGSQAFSNNLTYQSGSIFEWDINTVANASDSVSVGGSLTVDSGAIFKIVSSTAFTDVFWNTTRSWNVFGGKAFNAFTLNFIANNIAQVAGDFASEGAFTFTNSNTNLTWTAVPEPTSALAGLLLTAGLLRRRRK
jgi:fibronectin-binding autotransporter adhesin